MKKQFIFMCILGATLSSMAVKTTNLLIFPSQGKTVTRDTLIRGIHMAKSSLHIASPVLNDLQILESLQKIAEKGVSIHILLNPGLKNKHVKRLAAHKHIQYKMLSPQEDSGLTRFGATYIIVDNKLLIMSGVPLEKTSLVKSQGFGYIVHNQPIVQEIGRVFQLDWAQKPATLKGGPVVWGPDNTRSQLLSNLKRARNTIHIMTPPLTDEGITFALCHLAKSGIHIKLLTPAFMGHRKSKQKTNAIMLRKAGVDLHYLPEATSIIGTYATIDGVELMLLSTKLDAKQLDTSREFGVVSKSVRSVTQFLKTFDKLWSTAKPRV